MGDLFQSLERQLDNLCLTLDEEVSRNCVPPACQERYKQVSNEVHQIGNAYEEHLKRLERLIEEQMFSQITDEFKHYEETLARMVNDSG